MTQSLPAPTDEWRTVDLSQLVGFWSHPVRFFLQHRLEMQIRDDVDLLEESEPFQPGYLDRYTLADRLIDSRIIAQAGDKLYAQLQAEGVLPHGNFGRNFYEELSGNVEAFVPGILPFLQDPREPLEVNLVIDSFHLTGWLNGLFAAGCIRYRPAKLKGRDLVKLWVEHLAYNALDHPGNSGKSIYVASDATVVFRPVESPLIELQKLLDLYWQGLSAPLHFYPETSRAWFEGRDGRKEHEALKVWNKGFNWSGEGEDLAYRIALQGSAPFDPGFVQLAAAVYGPLYEHLENGNADV